MQTPATPDPADTAPPVLVSLPFDLNHGQLHAVLYRALRAQETDVHNGAPRGKPAEELDAAEVAALVDAVLREGVLDAIQGGVVQEERDHAALPTVAAWCSDTAAKLVRDVYGLRPAEPWTEQDADYCRCQIAGARRDVLVTIQEGGVCAVTCASCGLSVPYLEDMAAVNGEDIPMVMTTTVEQYFNPLDMIRPEVEYWHALSARPATSEPRQ